MPNGGSDCCGTCWFNEKNEGEAGYEHAGGAGQDRCVIRDLAVDDPFYTYCANHPHRNPNRLTTPIGPVFTGDSSGNRDVWRASPDTEEIRMQLLALLTRMGAVPEAEYPIGPRLDLVVIRQLGEFLEQRAVPDLERIAAFDPSQADAFGITRVDVVEAAKAALARIAD